MRTFKRLGVLVVLAVAVGAFAANASAATFTASATGSLSGKALTTQTYTTNAGQIKCTTAKTTGTITSTTFTQQTYKIEYSGCTAFGFAGVDISPAEYQVTSNGTAHLTNTVTVNVTSAGCHKTFPSQTALGTVSYSNNGTKTVIHSNITNLVYTGTGGLCGLAGNNGTLSGTIEIERVGGGSVSYDP